MDQNEITQRNSEFWNELCGSQLAKSIGVTDSSPASLKKFDDWYLEFSLILRITFHLKR